MSDQRLIRKYVNRRLYDTTQSRYVNLQDLRELIIKGSQVKVVEQATGADITTPVHRPTASPCSSITPSRAFRRLSRRP